MNLTIKLGWEFWHSIKDWFFVAKEALHVGWLLFCPQHFLLVTAMSQRCWILQIFFLFLPHHSSKLFLDECILDIKRTFWLDAYAGSCFKMSFLMQFRKKNSRTRSSTIFWPNWLIYIIYLTDIMLVSLSLDGCF